MEAEIGSGLELDLKSSSRQRQGKMDKNCSLTSVDTGAHHQEENTLYTDSLTLKMVGIHYALPVSDDSVWFNVKN